MSAALLVSPASALLTPRPLLWTCAEFHRFGDLGLFEGRRAMLIDGVLLEQGPMNPPHALTLELSEEAIRTAFGAGWRVRVQMPLVLGQHTDPLPDLAVVRGRPRDVAAHPTTAALIVEVADTSLRFDTTEKVGLYAAAGITDYWVLDVNARVLLVFRDPRPAPGLPYGHDYATRLTLGLGDAIAPLAAPTAAIPVAELLI